MNIRLAAILAIAALAAQPALAQNIKPGLWETNNKIGGGKMQGALAMVQQQMQNMSPEQRSKIEGMMSSQGVVISNDGLVAKVCVTPDMAAKRELPIQQRTNGNCTFQPDPPSGNKMTYYFSCANPKTLGEGTATFLSPTSYTSTTKVTTTATGASETVSIDSTARWVGAECGSVK
ncbi:DUF3617 domain-containing protein [Massilia sp. TWR1-2-2]|uniref:DUF3617 domain-containing protein n=1 Tax=Massilia sp. TWR1-2-2 TaxID=2804584 RepID=UPI003CE96752